MSDTENTNGEEMEQPATTGTSSQQNNTVSNMANVIPVASIRVKTTSGFKNRRQSCGKLEAIQKIMAELRDTRKIRQI